MFVVPSFQEVLLNDDVFQPLGGATFESLYFHPEDPRWTRITCPSNVKVSVALLMPQQIQVEAVAAYVPI